MKKAIIIAFILLIILSVCLTGCFNRFYINTYEVEATYNDKLLNSGERCAINNGCIYYFSNEQDGIYGIYKMDTDGGNIELLIPCPDIRRLTIFDDCMYYVGLNEIHEFRSETPWDVYSILKSDDFRTSYRVEDTLETVYDAYVFEDEFIITYDAYEKWAQIVGEMYAVINNTPVFLLKDDFTEQKIEIDNDSSYNSVYIFKYNKGNFLFISNFGYKYFGSNDSDIRYEFQCDIIEGESGEKALPAPSWPGDIITHFLINNDLYISKENKLFIIDLKSETVKKEFSYEISYDDVDEVQINHVTLDEGSLYADIDVWEALYNKRYSQKDIRIDVDTGDVSELLSLEKKEQHTVYMDHEQIITFEGRHIKKYEHDGSRIVNEKTLYNLGLRYKRADYLIDFAGDWMFVYDTGLYVYDRHYRYRYSNLICKINMATDEVIENEVPFDYDQFKDYIVEE